MAISLKRTSSVLSKSGTAPPDLHKKRCTDREDQNSQLPHPSSTTANTQCHGGPPKPPRAPKLDEALELSPMCEAPVGVFGDITDYTSLDHSLPMPSPEHDEQAVSKLPHEPPPPPRLMHQGDHLPSISMLGTLCLRYSEPLYWQSPRARRDHQCQHQHHEPASVGPGLDTVLVPRYHTHPYFNFSEQSRRRNVTTAAAQEQYDAYDADADADADDERVPTGKQHAHAWSLRSRSPVPETRHLLVQGASDRSRTGLLAGTIVVAGRSSSSFRAAVRAERLGEAWWCRCV